MRMMMMMMMVIINIRYPLSDILLMFLWILTTQEKNISSNFIPKATNFVCH